jgi:uncharacterized SAM-binding protein YcdF (DUF218 family)
MHSWFHDLVDFLIPPASLPVIGIVGALAATRWPRIRRAIIGLTLGSLLVLSLPITAGLLITSLERGLPLVPPPGHPPAAIVILSADAARSPGGKVSVGPLTLERLRAGARLARKVGLPILVTGGSLRPGETPIAELMAQSLSEDFGTPATWIESASKDTWENARFSAVILREHHIRSIYLVTAAWHMQRALIAFSPYHLTVVAAPTHLDRPPSLPSLKWGAFVPEDSAWSMSYFALHEWLGSLYYELRRW